MVDSPIQISEKLEKKIEKQSNTYRVLSRLSPGSSVYIK